MIPFMWFFTNIMYFFFMKLGMEYIFYIFVAVKLITNPNLRRTAYRNIITLKI